MLIVLCNAKHVNVNNSLSKIAIHKLLLTQIMQIISVENCTHISETMYTKNMPSYHYNNHKLFQLFCNIGTLQYFNGNII